MFRKEEEAIPNWSPENVDLCARRQCRILDCAAEMTAPGGKLVYSTCTFAPQENEQNAAKFIMRHPDFQILDLPSILGTEYMERTGLAAGRPEYASGEGIPGQITDSLGGTIRLWPHRLEGEGHFAAVLRKEGKPRTEAMPVAAAPAGGIIADSGRVKPGKNGLEHRGKNGKDQRGKRGKAAGKGKRRDPREADLLRLWQEFAEDTLRPAGSDFAAGSPAAPSCGPENTKELTAFSRGEENLHCFGDTLYALPLPAASLPLNGLRVLRAGLQLGSVTKGRFVPSHSLGMALHMEEVRRSVNLAGSGEEAYAWIRGETIPVPPECAGWKGWVLVCIDGCAAGWGKAAGGMVKNH